MGFIYHENNKNNKAIECYEKVIKINPNYYNAWNNMGVVYMELNKKEKAIECYKKAVDIKSDYYDAWNNMGNAYSDIGEKEKAIECYKKAVELKPEDNNTYMNLGFLYLKESDLKLSEKYLLKSVELGGLDFGNQNLGHIYLVKGEIEKALEHYKKGVINFSNKDEFFKGFDEDYKYLKQYGLNKETYESIRQQLL